MEYNIANEETKEVKNSPKFLRAIEWHAPCDITHHGYYSRITPVSWESCRERFQVAMSDPKCKSIFFSVRTDDDRYAIASFMHKTETILGIKRKTTYSEIYKKDGTYYRNVLRINIARFWKAEYIRSSLFTLLLRVGAGYNSANGAGGGGAKAYDPEEDNYEECLMSQSYITQTSTAMKRFLCGFTHYTGASPHVDNGSVQNIGWVNLMLNQNGTNNGNGWKLLSKPTKEFKNIIGAGKFWG